MLLSRQLEYQSRLIFLKKFIDIFRQCKQLFDNKSLQLVLIIESNLIDKLNTIYKRVVFQFLYTKKILIACFACLSSITSILLAILAYRIYRILYLEYLFLEHIEHNSRFVLETQNLNHQYSFGKLVTSINSNKSLKSKLLLLRIIEKKVIYKEFLSQLLLALDQKLQYIYSILFVVFVITTFVQKSIFIFIRFFFLFLYLFFSTNFLLYTLYILLYICLLLL